MLTINSLEEMKPYYNKNKNTYEFIENYKKIDICFTFSIDIKADINAGNIEAVNINAWNINAGDINARDIVAERINARNIDAGDIDAWNINAGNISFYAICCAHQTLKCKSIEGRRENAKYFCLDNEVEFIK